MMAATTRAKRTVATNTATITPTMTGTGDSSGEETSSTLPPPASAVEEGKPGKGEEMEWGWEVVVCSAEAVPIEENTKVLKQKHLRHR